MFDGINYNEWWNGESRAINAPSLYMVMRLLCVQTASALSFCKTSDIVVCTMGCRIGDCIAWWTCTALDILPVCVHISNVMIYYRIWITLDSVEYISWVSLKIAIVANWQIACIMNELWRQRQTSIPIHSENGLIRDVNHSAVFFISSLDT